MIVQHRPPLHLSYCLNIHPGESWGSIRENIVRKAVAVKQLVAPDQWFGLGLRIGALGVSELMEKAEHRDEALNLFAEHGLYPFSINGFPYGRFHRDAVKDLVYAPDWRMADRRNYTFALADCLAGWLPEGIDGSISTVPGSYKSWVQRPSDLMSIADHLAATVAYLVAVQEDTGREIHIGLEPEPGCLLETTAETVAFFKDVVWQAGVEELQRLLKCYRNQAETHMRRHLGVCVDTCHLALQYEDPAQSLRTLRSEGIRISKVQISAALKGPGTPEAWDALCPFAEPIYLHQTHARLRDGGRRFWVDLPEALAEGPQMTDVEEIRTHFHVPLFMKDFGALTSTADALTPEFFHELRTGICSHVEIETYTFDVIPEEARPPDVTRSIAREFSWVLSRLSGN